MDDKKIITGRFDKKENFGFLIPDDKNLYKSDFFVALRNSNNAGNGDIVEAIELKKRQGKSSEVKIVKILEKGSGIDVKNQTTKNTEIKSLGKGENTIIGIFSQGKGDFGFIDVEGIDKGFFVFSNNKNGALDGDKVEAITKVFNGKTEAEIIRIVERKIDLIVGEYLAGKDNRFGFVKPNNPQVKTDIFVPGKRSMDAQTGDIVGVHVIDWTGKNPEGTIKEILGKKGDKKIDVLGLIVEGGARIKFSEEVLKYAKNIEKQIGDEEYKKRKNLTKLFTFTIDGEDAKDLDDAISIEKLEVGGYKLYVHIADVSHYVTEKNPLDVEAYKRATSIYLVDRVIPMLPEQLSNDLCSLNPNTEKLTLTCEMIIGNNGKISGQKVYESIINSDFRLTYKEIDEILGGKKSKDDELMFGGIITSELIDLIKISDGLKVKIKNYRESTGVLNFDFPETKILLDIEGNPVDIKEYPRYDSNKLIEEFMISANEAVSREFSDLPFLYRIHEEPKDDDLAKLQDTLNLFGIEFVFKNGDTKEFSVLLEKINNPPLTPPSNQGGGEQGKKMFLEKSILRALSKAIYSKENFGHFGLGLSFYSHFTSPIRRYPDLQIHRIIKEQIAGKLDKKRLSHYESILDEVSKHTSTKERRAEKLEYKIKDYYTVKYYKNKVGEEFDAIISGVLQKGFFVSLKDSSEGFVELTRSEFIESLQEHNDLSTGKKYRLGDSIRVKLIEADEVLLRLNFEVV